VKKGNLTYTLVLHQARNKLGLALMEYCVADCIYHLSNNPQSKIQGWCYSSKENMAKFLGTSSATIFNNINKLIEKGLVEKDEETKYLRTTKKWYENVIVSDHKEVLYPIKKLYTRPSRNFIPDYKETLYNNNNIDNNIYKDIYASYKKKICKNAKLTRKARLKIRARLKEYSVEELKRAMDRFASNRWWMEHNANRGIAWWFHSEDRIEQFLKLKSDKKSVTII